jgi:hypothetical protein
VAAEAGRGEKGDVRVCGGITLLMHAGQSIAVTVVVDVCNANLQMPPQRWR